MKRTLFIAALACLAVSACTQKSNEAAPTVVPQAVAPAPAAAPLAPVEAAAPGQPATTDAAKPADAPAQK